MGKIQNSKFKAARFDSSGGESLNYRIFIPDGYNDNKSYPVVLFFHGAGERGSNNAAQLKWGVKEFALDSVQAKHPSIIIAPQCPANTWWTGNRDRKTGRVRTAKKSVTRLQLSIDLLKHVQMRYAVDPTRFYVTGISMGGFATWAAIICYPELFAAAVPVCGGGDVTKAHLIKDIPIWNFHGAKDRVVPPKLSREMIQALHNKGASPGYTEYPDVGHDSWIAAYQEPYLFEWLFMQQRDSAARFKEIDQ